MQVFTAGLYVDLCEGQGEEFVERGACVGQWNVFRDVLRVAVSCDLEVGRVFDLDQADGDFVTCCARPRMTQSKPEKGFGV